MRDICKKKTQDVPENQVIIINISQNGLLDRSAAHHIIDS